MKSNNIESRRRRYFELSSKIAQVDDARLQAMFASTELSTGWGRNHTLEFGRHKVFVKRVPLTDLEFENPFSTRNLYDLPTCYNYGVGSAGFGAYRELLANIKTTNWVLDGQIETFPLMYHYRICQATGEKAAVDPERHEWYVNYWNGNENIGRYMLDRADAKHELVLFLEHIPTVLHPYLRDNSQRTDKIVRQLIETFDFLREKGVIHFDAHFQNILVDSDRPYLTDFGLVLDKSFELSSEERALFKAHTHYDYGEALSCLCYVLNDAYKALPETEKLRCDALYEIEEGTTDGQRLSVLLDNVAEIKAAGIIPLSQGYVDNIVKYRSVVALVRDFFGTISGNSKKDTAFPHSKLRGLLAELGVVE